MFHNYSTEYLINNHQVETGGGGGYDNQHQDKDPQLKGRNGSTSTTNPETEERGWHGSVRHQA